MAENNDEIWIDEKLNEESRAMILEKLKVAKPGAIVTMDLNLVRQIRMNLAGKLYEQFSGMHKITETELAVPSIFDKHDVPVTVYTPSDLIDNSPITMFMHGGGWSLGSRIEYALIMRRLADLTHTIWLSVEYRLAPENKYPVPYNDCLSVAKWLVENRDKVSPSQSNKEAKIGVAGDSAGGNLAALLTHELKGKFDYQILIYPSVRIGKLYESYNKFTDECYLLTPQVLDFFFTNFTDDIEVAHTHKMSPILNTDFSNMPKCLTIAAELDPLVDEGKAYHEKLLENGNQSTYLLVNGSHHGFFNFPIHMKNSMEPVYEAIVTFFKSI